jgi:hypothetical protein
MSLIKNNNKDKIKVFISYRSTEKSIADELKSILSAYEIISFLAPDDIKLSEDWQNKILEELKNATFIICVLSKKYKQSAYCLQETGMALILNKPIIPLSLDNTIPPGFISKYQSKQISEQTLSIIDIIPGILKANKKIGIELIFEIINNSKSWKSADRNFELIIPILPALTKPQANKLLKIILSNSEITGAGKCRTDYLPEFIQQCSTKLPKDGITELHRIIKPSRRKI